MSKKYLVVLDPNKVDRLDQYVIRPCSRSDVIDDVLGYILQSPYIIEAFVKLRNDNMLSNAMRDIPSE